jgi:hypothetical protein
MTDDKTEPAETIDDERNDATDETEDGIVSDTLFTYLSQGVIVVLVLLAVVATVRFYLSAANAISVWIAPRYEPIFQSAFNLAVVFACGLGLAALLRRHR